MTGRTIGVLVNPIAGIGGTAGLKGSDGATVQREAAARGAIAHAADRARVALEVIARRVGDVRVLTAAGAMGADAVATAGLQPVVVAHPAHPSTAADTEAVALALVESGAELVLFVGGDGTARDVASAVGRSVPVLGVPAGVKMYSACFAVSPAAAGGIAARWAAGESIAVQEREVLDVDEEQIRRGRVEPRLHGFVDVPTVIGRTQARKSATPASEAAAVAAASAGAIAEFRQGTHHLLGPGGTMQEIARQLGVDKTPLGVDVVLDGRLVLQDASERELLALLADGAKARAVVTVIGGQGFLLGRGNQQLSAAVIGALGSDPLLVVATEQKLIDLDGRPLLVDTGDAGLDHRLTGYARVVTGIRATTLYPVRSPENEREPSCV